MQFRNWETVSRGLVLLLTWSSFGSALAGSQEEQQLSLFSLFDLTVTTATKNEQKISEAPAIISIVTQEEIKSRGYLSVAEALKYVQGFYGIDDFVDVNYGVRGVNGGARSYNRDIKVMVNGQPTLFRPDGTNLLGLEYLPMDAVDHIEVIRGPASALYGANAYLAVVNVITKKEAQGWIGEGTLAVGQPSYASLYNGQVLLNTGGQHWSLLLSGAYSKLDRSGYTVPTSSPNRISLPATKSQKDTATPASFFGSATYSFTDSIKLCAQANYNRLVTKGEWLDFGTMLTDNLIALDNFVSSLKLEWRQSKNLTLTATSAYSFGQPGKDERLDIGDPATYPIRNFGYRSLDYSVEEKVTFREKDSFIAGVDYSSDREKLITVDNYNIASKAKTTPQGVQGNKSFINKGVYGQLITYPLSFRKTLGITGNVRFDSQNIYKNNTNYRVGLVDQVFARTTVKLLQGTSYRAPSAIQLYAQPLYPEDFIGNPNLKPATAATTELQVMVNLLDSLALSADVYHTHIKNEMEVVQLANTVAKNSGTLDSVGFESELDWRIDADTFKLGFQLQKTTETSDSVPFSAPLKTPTASYPQLISDIGWEHRASRFGIFGLHERYVSARRATPANIALNFLTPYQLAPYNLLDFYWAYEWKSARVNFTANNLLNKQYVEPGNSIDFPGRKRSFVVAYTQKF